MVVIVSFHSGLPERRRTTISFLTTASSPEFDGEDLLDLNDLRVDGAILICDGFGNVVFISQFTR